VDGKLLQYLKLKKNNKMNELLELKMFLETNFNRIKNRIEELKEEDDRLFLNYLEGKRDAMNLCIRHINSMIKYIENEK